MAGQGSTTNDAVRELNQNGWTVVFACVPNTPHLNVVPIPTAGTSSKQRYPDILAFRDHTIRLVEVEIKLSYDVAIDILTRFQEMASALASPDIFSSWRMKLFGDTGYLLPEDFHAEYELIVCTPLRPSAQQLIDTLRDASINVREAKSLQT
jgi:hypothetical protein